MEFILSTTIGVFIVLIGLLVKKFPDLIAGYNTMSSREKKTVDIDGLSSMMRTSLVVLGSIIALIYPIMTLFVLKQNVVEAMITIVLFGLFFILISALRFKKIQIVQQKKGKPLVIVSLSFIAFLFLLFGFIYLSTQTPKFKISDHQMTISGLYGIEVKIESIEIIDSIPQIIKRTDGLAFGEVFKGNFDLKGFGISKLYLESLEPPFIYLKTKSGIIIINAETDNKTLELSNRLISELGI